MDTVRPGDAAWVAVITLSPEGGKLAGALLNRLPGSRGYIHEKAAYGDGRFEKFSRVVDLTAEIFGKVRGLVYIAPCGAVVRAIAPHLSGKKTDPAVVQVDIGGRYAVSLLSGHEGGANDLAMEVANAIGAEPVISTSTEAAKNIIVGVGCRKGKSAGSIKAAIMDSLEITGVSLAKVRLIASADVKENEPGLIEAARELGLPVRFIPSEDIRRADLPVERSDFVQEKVNLPAVAEPAALLAGRRTSLILKKLKRDGVTVALAKENCSSLE
ncbi:MAG: cobalamin biosynthesis protein [Nitrospinae bacterium]|nr:cobalamin biosynthesis protein [Nitrospinota bacterium]